MNEKTNNALLNDLETYIDGIESYSKGNDDIMKCIYKIREILESLKESE